MKITQRMTHPLIATLITIGSLIGSANAAVIVSGDIAAGSGMVELSEDVTFTITASASVRRIVFDQWVTSDGTQTSLNPTGDLTYSLNGGIDQTLFLIGFTDNLTSTSGDVTADDGFLNFNDFSVSSGDTLTIRSGSFTVSSSSDFNPQASGTFGGDVFLASDPFTRISNTVAVPEPSSMTLFGLTCLSLLIRRVRR